MSTAAVMENQPHVPEVIPTFTATLIIRRFDPEVDDEPRWLRGVRAIIWTLLLGLSFYTLWTLVVAAPTMTQ